MNTASVMSFKPIKPYYISEELDVSKNIICEKLLNLDYFVIHTISKNIASRICLKIKNFPALSKDKAFLFFTKICLVIESILKDAFSLADNFYENDLYIILTQKETVGFLHDIIQQMQLKFVFPRELKLRLCLDHISCREGRELYFEYTEIQNNAIIYKCLFSVNDLKETARL